jgi:hypothetical protein
LEEVIIVNKGSPDEITLYWSETNDLILRKKMREKAIQGRDRAWIDVSIAKNK